MAYNKEKYENIFKKDELLIAALVDEYETDNVFLSKANLDIPGKDVLDDEFADFRFKKCSPDYQKQNRK